MIFGKVILFCIVFIKLQFMLTALSPPNILWIMTDDLGWGEVEVFPGGSKHGRISTPILNQFAAEGIQFMNAYSGYTVCAPSRTTFFTGRHSGMFPKYNLSGIGLDPGEALTITELLKDAGYETALFGKSAPLNDPLGSGFDEFVGQVSQVACHNMYPKVIDEGSSQGNYNLSLNWKSRSRSLCMGNPEDYSYTTDVFQNKALEWLDEYHVRSQLRQCSQQEDHPFFLYLSYTVPHAGGWSDDGDMSGAPVPTDGEYAVHDDWPNVEKDHASVITYVDEFVGQLISKLKSLEIDNNTITIFASDNGAHLKAGHDYRFFNSTGGLRGHKRSMYEGGHRSPTLIRWPGNVPAGEVSELQWAFWDVLPTLADLAGVPKNKLPNNLSGRSIVPALLNKGESPSKYLYFTGDSSWAEDTERDQNNTRSKKTTSYAIRSGRWKGVVARCTNTPSFSDEMQLYDLDEDPFETEDISNDFPDQVDILKNIIASEEGISCKCFQC